MRFGFPIQPYPAAMIVCAFVSLLLGARAWFGTRKALSRGFALLQSAIFVWSLFRFIQWEILSPAGQLEAIKVQYLGIVFIPASFYLIARALARRPVPAWELPLVLAPPIAAIAFIATNDLHHGFWAGDALASLPVNPKGGWGFWALVAYCYAFVCVSFLLLIKEERRSKGLYAHWIRQLIALALLPFAVNAVFVILLIDRTGYDPTPVAFAVCGILMASALDRFNILDAVPYAKDVILESIDSPLVVVDMEGLVVGANDQATRLLAARGGLEGSRIADRVPVLADAGADGDEREWSFGGTDFHITCHDVKRSRGRWRGRIFLFRDITALTRARREVEEARAKADAASAAKSSFLAVVSHELRNPLNAIIGLADLNLRDAPPPGIKEDLEAILSSGNTLLGLVNDLLDLSKIEAGKMELESVDFDLHEKAVSMLRAFRVAADKKGIILDIAIEEGTPRFVRGDPLRYGQVLMNLVSNAVKFTERGAVTVTLSPSSGQGGGDPRSLGVLSSVSDTGIGIAPESIPRLFNEFAQADASIGRRFGGTGLGLSISERLVALLGGSIEAKSSPGVGSTFSFTARFEEGDEGRALRARPRDRGEAASRALSVLVVDDDPVNGAIARRYLERMGHSSAGATTGGEGLELLSGGEFDLVLLDLGLPDMDGFEACRRMRSEASAGLAESLPIAAMTAGAESGLRGAVAAAGMIDCLSKPLDPSALERLLARVARTARELGPRAAASARGPRLGAGAGLPLPAATIAAPGTPLIDEAALGLRFRGDEAFMRELLAIFVDEAPQRLEAFSVALAARDLESLLRQSHALKGSALSLCAGPLGAAAGSLEVSCAASMRDRAEAGGSPDALAWETEALRGLLAATVEATKDLLGRAG